MSNLLIGNLVTPTQRIRKSVSISCSFKKCCSEDDPSDCLTIPTLNRGNGWHKSARHVLWETWPLALNLPLGTGPSRKEKKTSNFP